MGCSSGMLMSPDCQKGNLGDKMHFEPDGIALYYLCAIDRKGAMRYTSKVDGGDSCPRSSESIILIYVFLT